MNKIQKIKLTYNTKEDSKIRLFGKEFVNNNNKFCKLIINNQTQNITEFMENYIKNELEVELIINKKLSTMKGMFCGCKRLKSINGLYSLDTSSVIDMSFLFHECNELAIISGLTNWNTSRVTTMKNMFCKCYSLKNIRGFENWNLLSVTDMSLMFYECSSLSSLSELSKWNTSQVTNMDSIFYGCKKLKFIPHWKLLPIISKEKMFIKFKGFQKYDIDNSNNNIKENEQVQQPKVENNNINFDNKINDENDKDDFYFFNNPFHNNKNYKIIRNEALKFLPQIEIIFKDQYKITDIMINQIKKELIDLLGNKDFSIIEINKGSLKIIITLQCICKKLINSSNNNIQELYENIKNEVKEIVDKIKENTFYFVDNKSPDFAQDSVIDLTNERNSYRIKNIFKSMFENNEDISNEKYKEFTFLEKSNKISFEDFEKFINILSQDAMNQENNQFLKNFENFFDVEKYLKEALYESIFEYKIITIYLINEDKKIYEINKLSCPNLKTKIFFHGTQPENIKKILSENFKPSSYPGKIGSGTYFTNSLDYVTFYGSNKKRVGETKIPRLYQTFTFILSEVYYDEDKEKFAYEFTSEEVEKNGIKCAFVDGNASLLSKNEINDKSKFIANEFLITYKEQILPLYGICFMRCEYLIIWRDYNFDENNPNNYIEEDFKKMLEFNEEIKKFSFREIDSKVYYVKTSEEGLNLIKKKKYNKIILITNANNNAKEYINKAREIIGCNCFSLVSSFSPSMHIEWVSKMKNVLISNQKEFHQRFIRIISDFDIQELMKLICDIENFYGYGFDEFDYQIPIYPNFKEEGRFVDLTF